MKRRTIDWKKIGGYLFYPLAGGAAFLASQYLVLVPVAMGMRFLGGVDAKAILSEPVPYGVVCLVCYGLAVGGLWYFNRKRKAKGVFGVEGLPTWTDIGLGLAGFVVSFIVALAVVQLMSLLPWFDASEAQDVGFNAGVRGIGKVFAFLTLVVFGPVAEEVIFRGWIYGHLRKLGETRGARESKGREVRMKNVEEKKRRLAINVNLVMSIILTSVIFGAMHGQWNVAVNVFVMSVVCCLLREFTGTIYAGIILHMIKNWFAFMVIYVFHIL